MKLIHQTVGFHKFDNSPVTVTDPCYDSGSGHVVTVNIKPGKYRCEQTLTKHWFYNAKEDRRVYYTRVSICSIFLDGLEPFTLDCECVGSIGWVSVDAGLAGFYQRKPNYMQSSAMWEDFCDKVNSATFLITPEGFCTESGWGDGTYDVFAFKNKSGEIVGLQIRFW